jgi:hypothetical protein
VSVMVIRQESRRRQVKPIPPSRTLRSNETSKHLTQASPP